MTHPDLEPRFLEPKGWRWHHFKNKAGAALRFGSVYPESRIPSAVVVILPGRTEFIEKYFELAAELASKNLAAWILDWQGQGKSPRPLKKYPARSHSPDFQVHVDDLHAFILGYVKHACVHPDVGRIPMVMLANSMGGNIGLRYLHKYPGMFECAAFSAPMLGLTATAAYPSFILRPLTLFMHLVASSSYAFGQKDWNPRERIDAGAALCSDPVRGAVHDTWLKADPALQMGGVTFGWLYHALASCRILQDEKLLQSITTPCLLAAAGHDNLVDNAAILRAAKIMPAAKILEFPDSGHEILMECDSIRERFLEAFYQMIKETVIDRPETLKPF